MNFQNNSNSFGNNGQNQQLNQQQNGGFNNGQNFQNNGQNFQPQQNNGGGMNVDDAVAPSSGMGILPIGLYAADIVNAVYGPNSNQTGYVLTVEAVVIDGDFSGRKIFDNYSLQYSGQETTPGQVQQIAQADYAKLCQAIGLNYRPRDPRELLNGRLCYDMGMSKKPKVDKTDEYGNVIPFEPRNQVKDRLPISAYKGSPSNHAANSGPMSQAQNGGGFGGNGQQQNQQNQQLNQQQNGGFNNGQNFQNNGQQNNGGNFPPAGNAVNSSQNQQGNNGGGANVPQSNGQNQNAGSNEALQNNQPNGQAAGNGVNNQQQGANQNGGGFGGGFNNQNNGGGSPFNNGGNGGSSIPNM